MKGDNKEMELHFTPDEYQKSLEEVKLQQSKRSIRHNEHSLRHQNPSGQGQDVSQHRAQNSIPAGPDTHLYLPIECPGGSQLPPGPVYGPPVTFPGTYGTVGWGPQQPDKQYAGQGHPDPQYYGQGERPQWQPRFDPPNGPTNYPPNCTRVFPPPLHLVQNHIPQSDHARSYLTEYGRHPLGPANPSWKMRTTPLRPMDFTEGNLHHPEMEPDLVMKGHHHAKRDISRLFMPVDPQKKTKRDCPTEFRLGSSNIEGDGPPNPFEGAPGKFGFSLGKREEPTQHLPRHLKESLRRRQDELYAQGPSPRSKKPSATEVGWKCGACTFVNPPSYPGCKQCLRDRPKEYEVPSPRTYIMDEEEKNMVAKREASEAHFAVMRVSEKENERETANLHRTELYRATEVNVMLNEEQFECPVCFAPVPPGQGIRLQECLHEICRDCCVDHINISDEAELKCPFTDGDNDCQQTILDREIRQIVGAANYEAFNKRSLKKAEATSANTFHCLTPNCEGWCFYDDDHNSFACPICHKNNCLTCKVFHEGMNCRQYQDDIRLRAANDRNAQETQQQLEQLIVARQAQRCPGCGVVIQKKGGCTHMTCSVCHIEFTWTGIEM